MYNPTLPRKDRRRQQVLPRSHRQSAHRAASWPLWPLCLKILQILVLSASEFTHAEFWTGSIASQISLSILRSRQRGYIDGNAQIIYEMILILWNNSEDQIQVTCGFKFRQESTMWHQALAVLSIFSRHRISQRIDVTPWAADPSSLSQQVWQVFMFSRCYQLTGDRFFTSSHCLQNCFKGFCPRNFTENNAPTFLGLINFHLFAVPHLSIWILKGGRRTISFEQNVQESMGIIKSTYRIIQASNRTWLLHWHSCHWLEQMIHSESVPASLRYNSCCSKHDAKSDPSHAMPMLLMQ